MWHKNWADVGDAYVYSTPLKEQSFLSADCRNFASQIFFAFDAEWWMHVAIKCDGKENTELYKRKIGNPLFLSFSRGVI